MYYQTRLLAIDTLGHFVAAKCHAEYEVGGDDPRETSYASLVSGHIDALSSLRDLGPLGFPSLPASKGRVAHELNAAAMQDQLAVSGNYGASMADEYRANAKRMRHAARLAGIDGVRVPRRVLASRAGRIALGFDPALPSTKGELLSGMLRVIDVQAGAYIGDWSSTRFPIEGRSRGHGAERLFNVQLGRPVVLAADGASVILRNDMSQLRSVVACRLDEKLSEIGVASFGQGRVLSINGGWIAIDEEIAQH